ncbi:MAG: DUF5677 domain-containing protein [Planctomycetota bacterium]|nr:DUF5677 domain-containing protein [Planctomycetota bacterium]
MIEGMTMLPNESELSRAIKKELAEELAIASELLDVGIRLTRTGPHGRGVMIRKPRGLTSPALNLTFGAYSKMAKHLRSVIALCELGLGEDAGTIVRSLFETVLFLNFLLRPRMKLTENGSPLRSNGKELRASSTAFRTKMYFAHWTFEREKQLRQWTKLPELQGASSVLGDPHDINSEAQHAESLIGSQWAKRLRDKGTYSGLTIKDLAQSFRVLHFYRSLYKHYCATGHAGDVARFVEPRGENGSTIQMGPTDREVECSLEIGSRIYLAGIALLNDRLGVDFDYDIKQVEKRLKQHFQGHKKKN